MFTKSTWLHLRIPFSYFLMPVYFFALAISPNLNGARLGLTIFIIHFLLYPASNGYNSYFDKDEGSIGGLKSPPPVQVGLYYMSLLFDAAALLLGVIYVSPLFAMMMLIYGLASKAYSHPLVRLKKYPILGWLTVVFFQGFFTFLMCYVGINDFQLENLWHVRVLLPASLASVLLFATYPMTQVYQHAEDLKRGDRTISILLGIRGTFYFAMLFFSVAAVGFLYYFITFFSINFAYVFLIALSPVVIFFLVWMVRVHQDSTHANHRATMWLNFISATCLNGFFIYFFLETSHILQL
jgi:1,4-dihydroxy-2-naphthoate octaprenyltransferase